MGVNVSLVFLKGFCGYMGNSTSMIADSAHSLSDSKSDILVYMALRFSQSPACDKYPWGYGKADSLAASFVGVILIGTGVSIGVHATQILFQPELLETPTSLALQGAIMSLILKEGLYWITLAAANKIDSPALRANAWHHRTDALTSLVALVGISGAMYGHNYLDPLAGICIAGFIVKVGLELSISSSRDLLDCNSTKELEIVTNLLNLKTI
eukprot:UN04822